MPAHGLSQTAGANRRQTSRTRCGGAARPFKRLNLALNDADVVVSTTAADLLIVAHDEPRRFSAPARFGSP
jgi:glutamyl-tRNA reductase